jgi:holo-[acyl-carrier protein] synthase
MIYGIGVGDTFVRRVFTPAEAQNCNRGGSPFSGFALRFAAKEAFSKALGLGMSKGLKWREIEVFNYPSGKPTLRLHGISSKICAEKGITGIHLTLSDEGEYGVAMVVLESGDERA